MAEQRARGDVRIPGGGSAPVVIVLTSIAWREAWKYRDRAYRYCLHDIGHAWQALSLAARALGCGTFAIGHFDDDDVARALRLNEDEWPMLIVELTGGPLPSAERLPETGAEPPIWYGGQANRLSTEKIAYPRIDAIQAATKLLAPPSICPTEPSLTGSGSLKLPPPAPSSRAFGDVVRRRRSALDFVGGTRSMSLAQLSAILSAATQPLRADFAKTRFIQLYMYAHGVDGLDPGVYRFWPESGECEQLRRGDQRVAAAGLSLGQDLAGNACVAFSMIGDFERAARAHGDRAYRYVHFEAGAFGATGIGAFYDEEVHRYLNLMPRQGQVVYHFAIGYPVADPRIEE
jgi:nitroreductase